MRELILVTGGSRSGKSVYARNLAEKHPSPGAYIATCPRIDAEMESRITKHKLERDPKFWRTFETELDLPETIKQCADFSVILVDCLTLWIFNLMNHWEKNKITASEEEVQKSCAAILCSYQDQIGTLILVTNELGMGLVPGDPLSRLYRDLAGRMNQCFAGNAQQVWFLVSGQPLKLK